MLQYFALLAAAMMLFLLVSCSSNSGTRENVPLNKKERLTKDIDDLKKAAVTGDLVVRMSDDLISERVRYLNEKDYSYSHAGIILEKGGEKWVCHISPELPLADTLQFTPIDTFIDPQKNLGCALYRYALSGSERDDLVSEIIQFKKAGVSFDRVYDLLTDDKLYCSEMISKAVEAASHGRIIFRQITVPKRMQRMVASFFSKEHLSLKTISQRKIITVDNLYSMQACSLIMKFPLKELPEQ